MAEFRERWLTAQDGKRLYSRDYGPQRGGAVPVICLSGLTRNSVDFHRLASRLSKERRVICPDYRGRGRSDYDRDWRHYAPPFLLLDLVALIMALGLHRVVAIGTSLGGILAMALGAAMPTVLKGAVLNDVGPEVQTAGLDRIRDYIARDRVHPDWDSAVADLKSIMPDLSVPEPADRTWLAIAKSTWRRGEDGLLHYDFDTRLARTLDRPGKPAEDLWPLFRGLGRIPVAAVRGADSDVLTAGTLARMAESRDGNLITAEIPGVGHAPNLGEPAALEAIDALLARV